MKLAWLINIVRDPRGFVKTMKVSCPRAYRLIMVLWHRRRFSMNVRRVRGKTNELSLRGAVLNGCRIDIQGSGNRISVGPNAFLEKVTVRIRGDANSVVIHEDCSLANSIIWVEDGRCRVEIGSRTTFGGVHLAATEEGSRVVIGTDCMFAYDVDIRTGDSHGIYDSSGRRVNKAKNITIEDHVWISAHAVILKGAYVGRNAVVGTGAIVPRGVYPPGSIVAGNPARVVREGVSWSRERKDFLPTTTALQAGRATQ